MPDPIFSGLEDGRYLPSGHARGPWDPSGALHGGATAALLTRALERLAPPTTGLAIAHLDFQLVRAIPLVPLELTAEVEHPGRRVLRLAAALRTDQVVAQGRALCLLPVPDSVAALPEPEPDVLTPGPQEAKPVRLDPTGANESFGATAIEIRFLTGDFGPGPSAVWTRLRRPLVADEEPSPLMRAAAAADLGNGIGSALRWEQYLFINADLSIALWRPPRGEWIGVRARTLLGAGGVALAASVLYDEAGAFGRGQQSLLVQART
ncbi:MAG TPA: thioesterase family protein [Solirubrobacteraceae bacterium]|nr:thioesterase family protein [Solirubrobacteraceae bacterium]